MIKLPNGWGHSPASRKWHYFDDDSFSLCRKIGFYSGPTVKGEDDNPDNCAECKRRLKKLQLTKSDEEAK